jgi:hypothetical protein
MTHVPGEQNSAYANIPDFYDVLGFSISTSPRCIAAVNYTGLAVIFAGRCDAKGQWNFLLG